MPARDGENKIGHREKLGDDKVLIKDLVNPEALKLGWPCRVA